MKPILVLLITIMLTLTSTFIIGCSGKDRVKPSVNTVEIDSRIKTIPITPPDDPDSVVWKEFKWTVLTPEIIEQLLAKYKAGELDESKLVFYGLTTDGYENLSVNMAEVIWFIEQQKAVIMYYKDTVPEVIAIPPEQTDEEIPEGQ